MTEDEAKTKWCPFVRAISYGSPSPTEDHMYITNREGPDSLCIGSECMAWRTYELRIGAKSVIPDGQGYCGLAGRPDG